MVAFCEVEKEVVSVARAHGWTLKHGVSSIPCSGCFKLVTDAFLRSVPDGLQVGCFSCIKKAYEKDIRYWKGEIG